MKLSDGEKLILVMLGEIYDHLKINGEINHRRIKSAIINGQLLAIPREISGVLHGDDVDEETVFETGEILQMWSFIESSFVKLSIADKARVKAEAKPFGDNVRFPGFDGNNDDHLGIAQFYVKDMGRFSEFCGHDLNAHAQVTDSYRRMLKEYKGITESLTMDAASADQIITLLKARIHPDNRGA